jgi:hypothetical protein
MFLILVTALFAGTAYGANLDPGVYCENAKGDCVGGFTNTATNDVELISLRMKDKHWMQINQSEDAAQFKVSEDGKFLILRTAAGEDIPVGQFSSMDVFEPSFSREFQRLEDVVWSYNESKGKVKKSCETNGIGRHFDVWYRDISIHLELLKADTRLAQYDQIQYHEVMRLPRLLNCPHSVME